MSKIRTFASSQFESYRRKRLGDNSLLGSVLISDVVPASSRPLEFLHLGSDVPCFLKEGEGLKSLPSPLWGRGQKFTLARSEM